jgi:hypothetical protein
MIDPKEEPEIINKLYGIESPKNPVSKNENISVGQLEYSKENSMFSYTTIIMWGSILLLFIIFTIYYSIKYKANESNYIIKGNATSFKISLDEIKEDFKDFLRRWIEWFQSWNENISEKSKQFFFRQHVEDNTFKIKRTIGKKDKKMNENKNADNKEQEKPDE